LLTLGINGVKKIKVLIFGSNGLVGKSIVRKMSEEDYFDVIPSNRDSLDLFDFIETSKFISKLRPDVVINAAAKVGGIMANNIDRFDFIMENLKINMNILESLKPYPETKVINLGSSCIYPLNIENPINESSIMDGKLESTNSPYAMAKLTAIEIGDAMSKQFGHKILNLMPTNLYGPGDNFNPTSSHVIPGMIYKFHEAKNQKITEVNLWGDGTPLREFLYVDDLSEAIIFLLKENKEDYLINIGSSEEISIKELSSIIKNITKFEGSVNFDDSKPNGIMRKYLDSSLITSYGWKPATSLNKGLEKTYKWFLDNFEYIRS
tara:strand:- start:1013 stop:1975 length:963 start_codon:yes stop_codon:yes gene_type:complete